MKGTFQQYETWYFLYYNSSLKKPQTLFSLIFAKRKIIHNENKTFMEYNFIALFLSYCLSFAFQVKVKAIFVLTQLPKIVLFPNSRAHICYYLCCRTHNFFLYFSGSKLISSTRIVKRT